MRSVRPDVHVGDLDGQLPVLLVDRDLCGVGSSARGHTPPGLCGTVQIGPRDDAARARNAASCHHGRDYTTAPAGAMTVLAGAEAEAEVTVANSGVLTISDLSSERVVAALTGWT